MPFDTGQSTYVALRNIVTERTESVVAWIGSGLSVSAGLPTWRQLRELLTKELRQKAETLNVSDRKRLLAVTSTIESEENNWQAFEMLHQHLGVASWRQVVRDALSLAPTVKTPPAYTKLWQLRIHGALTLNLDRLATKAYADLGNGALLTEFNGSQTGSHTHVLKSPRQFVCHLHGDCEDASSWILTSRDLRLFVQKEAYRNFISAVLSNYTVVFLGISADDSAVGGFLENLNQLGIDTSPHYWVTDRKDIATDAWAENIGVRVIRYTAAGGDHSELEEMLDDLLGHIPQENETSVIPVVPEAPITEARALFEPAALMRQGAEQIRIALNAEAKRILADPTTESYEEYERFTSRYDEAIYRAWYTSTLPGQNILLGLKLEEEIATGAFGRVYRATDRSGAQVAVKVLHQEIRVKGELLQSFRRGVRSMRILGENNVPGMVAYRDAFEIPAFVVMDWIDGPNLTDAVLSQRIADWAGILRVATDIASTVRRGHQLPERVLHRDLRPSNIMLKAAVNSSDDWEVVVLDFDLSWHRGALERSVTHGSSMLGYMAPEQIQQLHGVSTRHASVDSFGLGMTLFFIISRRNPIPEECSHKDWETKLQRIADSLPCESWISAPRRFTRLIFNSTRYNQAERWDMAQIQRELERLQEAVLDPSSVTSAEMWAEELAARCDFTKTYVWNDGKASAVATAASGITVEIVGEESHRSVRANLTWGNAGVTGRKNIGKWIEPAANAASEILERGGWSIDKTATGTRWASIRVSATLPITKVSSSVSDTVRRLDRAMNRLRGLDS